MRDAYATQELMTYRQITIAILATFDWHHWISANTAISRWRLQILKYFCFLGCHLEYHVLTDVILCRA
jgi:hypothetical protein